MIQSAAWSAGVDHEATMVAGIKVAGIKVTDIKMIIERNGDRYGSHRYIGTKADDW